MSSKLQLYHALYNNLLYDTDTLCNWWHCLCGRHMLCVDAPGQRWQYWLWESVSAASSYMYNIFSKSKDISCILLPLLLHWQQTGRIFSEVFSSGFRSPPVWKIGRHLSTNVRNSVCISAVSINSGLTVSWSQKSAFAFAVWWQNVLSHLEVTSHHPAALGIQSHFCCRR